ncbi:hypothetical protein Tco_1113391 [Tanacetum coccineum]|uniref:Uncharacterized protein n=1 Tax=Tanacetum coccineum TaxID=301880 RepID=A0ABQ5IS04_9ASTR
MKVLLNLSTAYHPQTDGQTEIVNKCVNSTHTTPFEIVYGQAPSLRLPYIAGTSLVEKVDRTMQAREQAIAMLQFHLKRSQERMKKMVDKHRIDRNFEVGMKVYLKLQPCRQLCKGINHQVGLFPQCGTDGMFSMEPKVVTGRRVGKLNNKAVLYVLDKYVNQAEEDATWKLYANLIQRFPQMELHS